MGIRTATPFKHPKTGVYYIRRAVPTDLRAAFGKAEYKKSLNTKDSRRAKELFPYALQECEADFARARASNGVIDVLDDDQIKDIADAWASHILEEGDECLLENFYGRAYENMQQDQAILLPALKNYLAPGHLKFTAYEFDDFLKSHGYNIPSSSASYRRVHLATLRSWVRTMELGQRRLQGEVRGVGRLAPGSRAVAGDRALRLKVSRSWPIPERGQQWCLSLLLGVPGGW